MATNRCPRRDPQRVGPNDVLEVTCECGEEMEFFRDDRQQKCKKCGKTVRNPNVSD